jgi:hypothetical protein
MLGANSYMFRRQVAILREFNNKTKSWVQHVIYALVALTFIIKIKNFK